jgi:hypothetical protein
MLAPVTHILPLTTIRRTRVLPAPGRVVVRKGQKVAATDVVAEARLTPEHVLLDLSRGLGLSEEQADRHIQVKAGDQVAQGDVVAGPVGMARRVVRAPRNARVVLAGGGQMLLEIDTPPFELRAGLPGLVAELVGERGVEIEATGALVQGVWGNGRLDAGLMYVLARTADETFSANRLDVSHRGSVILAGHVAEAEVFKAAADLPLRGMILGSMAPGLIGVAGRVRFPIVVIEGFGRLAMNTAAFRLLATNERREVALNAEAWDRFGGARPEVVIPLPAGGEQTPLRDVERFSPGQQVHVVRAPHLGQIGVVVEVVAGLSVMPDGVRAAAAQVRLENGETLLLPLANLEVLG